MKTDPVSPLLYDGYTVYTPGVSERPVGGSTTFYHLDALGSVAATTNASQQEAALSGVPPAASGLPRLCFRL